MSQIDADAPPRAAPRQVGSGLAFVCVIHLMNGINLPYFPLWLEESRGLSGQAIGAILATATLMRVVAGPSLAAWAEDVGIRRAVGSASILVILAYCALFPAQGLAPVALLSVLAYSVFGAVTPFSEAVLMSVTGKGQRLSYGIARSIGSSMFILASLTGGVLVRTYTSDAVLPAIVVLACVLACVAIFLDPPPPSGAPRVGLISAMSEGLGHFRSRRLLLLTLAGTLIQASHAHYYNFSVIIWQNQGVGGDVTGLLWSTGVVAEIVLLALAIRLFSRWRAETLIALGGIGAMIRWGGLGFAPGLEWLFPLQALHCLTFAATHLGTIQVISEIVSRKKIPVVIAINSALAFGPGMALAALASGTLFDHFEPGGPSAQANGYWLMAGLGCAGFCVAVFSRLRRSRGIRVE